MTNDSTAAARRTSGPGPPRIPAAGPLASSAPPPPRPVWPVAGPPRPAPRARRPPCLGSPGRHVAGEVLDRLVELGVGLPRGVLPRPAFLSAHRGQGQPLVAAVLRVPGVRPVAVKE